MSDLVPAAAVFCVDGYVVAKFSAWIGAPPVWVHPAFDLDRYEWHEGENPSPYPGPGILDLSGNA